VVILRVAGFLPPLFHRSWYRAEWNISFAFFSTSAWPPTATECPFNHAMYRLCFIFFPSFRFVGLLFVICFATNFRSLFAYLFQKLSIKAVGIGYVHIPEAWVIPIFTECQLIPCANKSKNVFPLFTGQSHADFPIHLLFEAIHFLLLLSFCWPYIEQHPCQHDKPLKCKETEPPML